MQKCPGLREQRARLDHFPQMYSLGSINGKILPTKGKEIHVSSALSGAAISQLWSVLLPRGLHLHTHVYMITASSHVLRKAQLSPHVADYGLQF